MKYIIINYLIVLLIIINNIAYSYPKEQEETKIYIQADSAQLDYKKGLAIYNGNVVLNVVLNKVPNLLKGNTITLQTDKHGHIEYILSTGNPAYYEHIKKDEITKAYSLNIKYDLIKKQVYLIKQAKVIKDGNMFESENIIFNTKDLSLKAGSGINSTIGKNNKNPRIHIVITPKKH